MKRRIVPLLVFLTLFLGCLWAQERMTEREALEQLITRARSGEAKALFQLARLYETGHDTIITQDSAESVRLYLLSAEKGYTPAQNFIGFKYYKGEGLNHNIDSALYWIRKAAEAGDVTAAANLGYLYTEGKDIEHDEKEAVKWWWKAAQAGIRGAQEKLVEYERRNWESLSADSLLNLGLPYFSEKGEIVGAALLKISAEKGNPQALALMGEAYSKGIGVPYDHQRSLEYFFKAAVAGNPSAQFIIGELLEIFPDALTHEDVKDASYWLEKAREKDVVDSDKAYQLLYSSITISD